MPTDVEKFPMRCFVSLLSMLVACAPASAQWRHLGSIPAPEVPCGLAAAHGTALALVHAPDQGQPDWLMSGIPQCNANGYDNSGVIMLTGRRGFARPDVRYFVDGFPVADARFGQSIAASRSGLIVLGAPGPSGEHGTGMVGLFRRNPAGAPVASAYLTRLSGSGAVHGFGTAVASDGDLFAVSSASAPGKPPRVAVFRLVGTGPLEPLGEVTGDLGSTFGNALALRSLGGTSFVLAVGVTDDDGFRGRVDVFIPTGTGIQRIDELRAPVPLAADFFGRSVGFDDEFLYVGGPGRTRPMCARSGSVAVFANDPGPVPGYALEVELFPQGAEAGARCGASLATDHSDGGLRQVAIGCPDQSAATPGDARGSARVFRRTLGPSPDWLETELAWSAPASVSSDAQLGSAIAIVGDRVYVSAPRNTVNGLAGLGSVEVFARNYDGLFGDRFESVPQVP
jgi:hypothetical protein